MYSGNALSVFILNDGSPDEDQLRQYICFHKDLEIVSECDDPETARQQIIDSNPELIFLDFERPGPAVLKLLDDLPSASRPVLILVTSCHKSAVTAFDLRILDCLQKPVEKERFDLAIERVREHLRRNKEAEFGRLVHGVLTSTIQEPDKVFPGPDGGYLERLTIKEGGRVLFVPVSEIDYIEASGNYMAVHTGTKTHLVYETMGQMENQLDPGRFLRIHRSHIVNIGRIRELQPYFNGEYIVLLSNGTKLKISRSYRDRARLVLGIA